MSKGSSGGGDTTIQYAPYIQDAHGALINIGWDYTVGASGYADPAGRGVVLSADSLILDDPYSGLTIQDPDDILIGTGVLLTAYPSLFSLFESFVSNLDIDALYTQILNDMVDSTTIGAAVAAENDYLEDDLDQKAFPRLRGSMRDMNAVMTSAFFDTQTIAEIGKQKAINKYKADLNIAAMNLAQGRWAKELEWNQHTVDQYAQLVKLYFMTRFDYVNAKGEMETRSTLWPFTIIDHQRAVIGTLNGAHAAAVKGEDKVSRAIGQALGLAAVGSQVAGWFGGGTATSGGGAVGQITANAGIPAMLQGGAAMGGMAIGESVGAASLADYATLGVGLMML